MVDDSEAGVPSGTPVCPHCGRPRDDYADMTEEKALEAIHLGLLRDLARKVNSGEATGVELNVARAVLKDNHKKVDQETGDAEADEALPPQAPKRQFPDYKHTE